MVAMMGERSYTGGIRPQTSWMPLSHWEHWGFVFSPGPDMTPAGILAVQQGGQTWGHLLAFEFWVSFYLGQPRLAFSIVRPLGQLA